MLLLSDGTVMAQDGTPPASGGKLGAATANWYRLTPNVGGSYVRGRWSVLAPMHTPRRNYASDVLPSGQVLVAGGEYTDAGQVRANTGELFDPVTNAWRSIAKFPQSRLGDAPSELLPDGRILVGYIRGTRTYIYDPTTNRWSPAAAKFNGDSSSEETWVKLPDGSILSYSIAASNRSGTGQAQRYIPSANRWEPTGPVPVPLSSGAVGNEIGPAFLLPDGRVFFLGGNSTSAIYTPATNSWIQGPGVPAGLAAADAPGAILPNGQVIFAASIALNTGQSRPTGLFVFRPGSGRIQAVHTPGALTRALASTAALHLHMLMLPSGQLLLADGTNQPWVYTAPGSPARSWKPAIRSVGKNGDGTFTLTGIQLNGISEGAAFGDDAQMATNYPIVQLRDTKTGRIAYARTFDWSSTQVATGLMPETTEFALPAGLRRGSYRLSVIANGIASPPVSFRVR
jgi:hypothetical protein